MIKKIDHFVITANKVEECLRFYEKCGFTIKEATGRYELYAGDFKINLHIKNNELAPKARNITYGSADICFETDENINDLKMSLQAKGLDVLLGVVDRNGSRGKMQSIYLQDPDGNLIEFCKYNDK